MRRLMLSMFVVGVLSSMVGCNCNFTHGICDCQFDDYCTSRSPWIRYNSATQGAQEIIPAPSLPEVKNKAL